MGHTTKKIANQSTMHISKQMIINTCTQSTEKILDHVVSNDDMISKEGTSISTESVIIESEHHGRTKPSTTICYQQILSGILVLERIEDELRRMP
ncbi:hypothetical protein GJ496_001869 [Pomphorhynchus laevis]|nr:hypothetical protein GJ496_001869 [Pomphorhynchus laevis]